MAVAIMLPALKPEPDGCAAGVMPVVPVAGPTGNSGAGSSAVNVADDAGVRNEDMVAVGMAGGGATAGVAVVALMHPVGGGRQLPT